MVALNTPFVKVLAHKDSHLMTITYFKSKGIRIADAFLGLRIVFLCKLNKVRENMKKLDRFCQGNCNFILCLLCWR